MPKHCLSLLFPWSTPPLSTAQQFGVVVRILTSLTAFAMMLLALSLNACVENKFLEQELLNPNCWELWQSKGGKHDSNILLHQFTQLWQHTNYVRPSQNPTMKKSQKSPTAWSAPKYCTRYLKLGRCTRLCKPGHCTLHMNDNNRQTT